MILLSRASWRGSDLGSSYFVRYGASMVLLYVSPHVGGHRIGGPSRLHRNERRRPSDRRTEPPPSERNRRTDIAAQTVSQWADQAHILNPFAAKSFGSPGLANLGMVQKEVTVPVHSRRCPRSPLSFAPRKESFHGVKGNNGLLPAKRFI